MTPKEVLVKARELISNPERWTKGVTARGRGYVPVHPTSEKAVCWCSIGALRKVTNLDPAFDTSRMQALSALSEVISRDAGVRGVANFNDTRTHAEVLSVFDKAIEELQ